MVHMTGPIGCGKTTLALRLRDRLGLRLLPESADRNPFLARFYADPSRWAFAAQRWFHDEALSQARQASSEPGRYVWDRPPRERHEIFIPRLVAAGAINDSQRQQLTQLTAAAQTQAPAPTLTVGLTADLDLLVSRIEARGRSFEQQIDLDFLAEHLSAYEAFWADSPQPLLLLDAAVSPDDLLGQVCAALAR
jgi:deoxyadenosine/deoxycytidine kinase